MKKQLGLIALCLWGLLMLFPSTGMVQEKKSYTFAVVPQTKISDIYERWAPFLKKLSQDVGVEFTLAPYNTIGQFAADVKKGVPDFAYMNPYHEFVAKETQGYIPLVRDRADLFGILVVNKSSTINSVKDLDGKELVFPSHAFAADQYMRALLTDKEKINFKTQLVASHGSVYRAVKLETAAGGGGIMKTLEKEPDDIKSQLKIIYETPKTASHPISAHPRVPDSIRKKVAQTILGYSNEPSGKDMLRKIQIPDPVAADYQRDYAPLKKMEAMLKKYEASD
jgi:phosphonate transport system substrate-binding protein